ncbi:hypothetical protein [Marinobacter sp. JSM 1782161]|uniref:hypothetical protein n=1 Tax=Marinobacter sp. JSM 1782161 TaxID=2685906 RepID=UPI001402FF55|nr:hypothetical protein [Marinobacter sp. JSM 1782161]
MSFWKTLFAVVLGNLLTVVIATGLALAFLTPAVRSIETALGIQLPAVDITVGTVSEDLSSNVATRTAQPSYSRPADQIRAPGQAQEPSNDSEENAGAIRSSAQMCRFWNKEYATDRTIKSKKFREQACSRYERLSGRSRTTVINFSSTSTTRNDQSEVLIARRAEAAREKREAEALERRCEQLNQRLDYIQDRLRSGYTVSEGNRLRADRRELSQEYASTCLRGR